MLKADLHIHTIMSGHAYSTVDEIIAHALKNRMKIVAITDHGPDLLGGPNVLHFGMGRRIKKHALEKGLILLWGCEANIINTGGDLDIVREYREKRNMEPNFDFALAAIHISTDYKNMGKEVNTKTVINSMKHPIVKILSHPVHWQYRKDYPIDLRKVCEAAVAKDVLLELNLSVLAREPDMLMQDFRMMIDVVRKAGKKLIVNSDAHFTFEIGDDSVLQRYKKELGLTDNLIINNYPEELLRFLGKEELIPFLRGRKAGRGEAGRGRKTKKAYRKKKASGKSRPRMVSRKNK